MQTIRNTLLGSLSSAILILSSTLSAMADIKERGRLGPWYVVHATTADDETCQVSTCSGLNGCNRSERAGLFLSGWVKRDAVTPVLLFNRDVPRDFRATLSVGKDDFLFGHGQGNSQNSAIPESEQRDKTILRALARHAKSKDAIVTINSSYGQFDIPLDGFSSALAFIQSRCGIKAAR